ncbi:uncharacterized protein F5Z01DRAFT_624234 [Emericellopsis atlantica]|uniref:D-2-hydroxyglutarate dehydrogenase, mitochondrial n=1 Tax=Emericellopsis atlantica TaxID=2614577 RepID=A0A9P8CNR8_9HYPO|nr:uncharacterized protein F5Z01DRAFT_624234 [Emericellopsis atlantica]KAG9253365.1 hypothetical protein F5Z01DRAFT_624234 [Emericellopsis atlantica]
MAPRTRVAQVLRPLARATASAPTAASSRVAMRCIATSAPRLLSASSPRRATKLTTEMYPGIKRDERFKQMSSDDVAYFKELLGSDSAIIDGLHQDAAADIEPFNEDWLHKYKGQCRLVLKPGSTEDVSAILKYCNEQKLAVVPQGGNTGLVGGSVPVFDEIVINMARMNKIHSFDEVSGSLVADAGCILETTDQYLAERGAIFPLDLGAKGSCHIGGNVATNAGGLRLLRYGSLHGSVLGLEVVLPDGTIMNDLCTLRKNNTGYDLKQLHIGAEGTIGIITKVSIQCPQRSSAINVAFFGLESFEKVQQAFREAKGQLSEILSAFELMDGKSQSMVHKVRPDSKKPLEDEHPFYCLIETSGSNGEHDYAKLESFLEDVMTKEIITDGVVAQDATQLKSLWSWREGIPECLGHWGGTYKYDVSIPIKDMYAIVDDISAKMEEAGLIGETDEYPVVGVVGYGHMGDSNLHLNVAVRRYDTAVEKILEPYVYEWIADKKGSISAEHGLGIAKKNYIGYSRDETTIGLMKQIKNLYDPDKPSCIVHEAAARGASIGGRPPYEHYSPVPHQVNHSSASVSVVPSHGVPGSAGLNMTLAPGTSLKSEQVTLLVCIMVGVPGKYQGCETCRRRRVKCSNERPFCQKCANSGRQCEGYERERVFITGTPEHRGRVASHPRQPTSSASSSRRRHLDSEARSTPEITPERDTAAPFAPAWEDHIALDVQGALDYAFLTSLHIPPQSIVCQARQNQAELQSWKIASAPYILPDVLSMSIDGTLRLKGRCMAHLSDLTSDKEKAPASIAFLLEVSVQKTTMESPVQQLGPHNFVSFPNHHFFARVFRPLIVDWLTVPWANHPKTLLDQLLDLISFVPPLLQQLDAISAAAATTPRRQQAQTLLGNCKALESRFDQWLTSAHEETAEQQQQCYWVEETASALEAAPFAGLLMFRDGSTALMFLYFWMSQISFHRCIERLYTIIFEPVIDMFPPAWPELLPNLELDDLGRYQQTHELATSICRGLDSALGYAAQPELLLAPMTTALNLFRDDNTNAHDGILEIFWLEAFKSRLADKGQYLASMLERSSWVELARF